MKYDTKRQSIYLWINSDSTICTRQIVDRNRNANVFFVKYALITDLFIFVTLVNLLCRSIFYMMSSVYSGFYFGYVCAAIRSPAVAAVSVTPQTVSKSNTTG